MRFSPLLDQLVDALTILPGVGPKTAQRMALHLLDGDRRNGAVLAGALTAAIDGISQCQRCQVLCEHAHCSICDDQKRDGSLLCVVEMPADLMAIEQAGNYKGKYFVLMGRLSPIDGLGPDELGMSQLAELLQQEQISEVILATNPTVEGEATAHFVAQIAQDFKVKASRLAHGVPMGSELEYVDGGTLSRAFQGRVPV